MTADQLRQQADALRDLQSLRRNVPFEQREKFADVFRRLGRCIPTHTRPTAHSYDEQKQAIYADTQRILLQIKREGL